MGSERLLAFVLSISLHTAVGYALLFAPGGLSGRGEESFVMDVSLEREGGNTATSEVSVKAKENKIIKPEKLKKRTDPEEKEQNGSAIGSGDMRFGFGGLGFSEAKLQHMPEPQYPERSRIKEEIGKVAFQAVIETSGTVSDVKILESSGYERLDNAAKESLLKATFSPAQRFGSAVRSEKKVVVSFRLQD